VVVVVFVLLCCVLLGCVVVVIVLLLCCCYCYVVVVVVTCWTTRSRDYSDWTTRTERLVASGLSCVQLRPDATQPSIFDI